MGPTLEQMLMSFTNITPSDQQIGRIEAIRNNFKDALEALYHFSNASRERSIAVQHLETSLMYAVKGVLLEGV